jgi:hypothetical protein
MNWARGGTMITIDLNARVLVEEHNVYAAHLGTGYRLYREFRENSSLILELSGLRLEPDVSVEDQQLRRRLTRSRVFRSWYNRQPSDDRPSRNLNTHSEDGGGNSAAQLEGLFALTTRKSREATSLSRRTGACCFAENYALPATASTSTKLYDDQRREITTDTSETRSISRGLYWLCAQGPLRNTRQLHSTCKHSCCHDYASDNSSTHWALNDD